MSTPNGSVTRSEPDRTTGRERNLSWDEGAARAAVNAFSGVLQGLEASAPDCILRLRKAWRESYLLCGHKRLGRLLVGLSPEEACAVRRKGRTSAAQE
ncbi:MAG: hypothetical protein PHN82_02645 [bacterium]|nr:hypothetical protein [bacterium]